MRLTILTTLICLAHLSAATCPQYKPLTARQTCQIGKGYGCPSGKRCCPYSGINYCVSTDPYTCISGGNVVRKGQSVLLEDNCTSCTCHGYDYLICTKDSCYWPKQVPTNKKCPRNRPLNSFQQCRTERDCAPDKSCCGYSGSNYCVSTDPNTCISEGRKLNKGQLVTLKDTCSTCTCHGYDNLICTNDGCIWPKQKPEGCTYDGTFRYEGTSFPSRDGCNTCFCSNGNILCTLRGCIKFPFRSQRPYKGF